MPRVEVGDIVKDSVTGFKGMAIARTEWLNGCARILIQPQELTKEGKTIEPENIDENQIVVVKAKNHKAVRDTGGPRPDHLIKRR